MGVGAGWGELASSSPVLPSQNRKALWERAGVGVAFTPLHKAGNGSGVGALPRVWPSSPMGCELSDGHSTGRMEEGHCLLELVPLPDLAADQGSPRNRACALGRCLPPLWEEGAPVQLV